jgi:hypothetical protein
MLSMLIDPNRSFKNPPASAAPIGPNGRGAGARPGASPEPPSIDAEARPWLKAAAEALDQRANAVSQFARTGMISLEAVNIVMFCQQASPPRWTLLGYVRPPAGVPPLLWNEALLRANCVSMAMDTCAFGIDAQGSAVMVKQIPTYHYDDVQRLTEALVHMRDLAMSLRITVHAVATAGSVAHEPPSADMSPATQELAQLKTSMDDLAKRELSVQWHRPLLEQTLRALDLPVPRQAFGSVGAFKLGKRYVEVVAAPDKRHLLLSTAVNLPLITLAQRQAALETNLYLMTGAHCGLALAPEGASLQSRWDASDLDGEDLAGWLVDFIALATAIETPARSQTPTVASRP